MLDRKGVHIATVNSYLATRDFELLRPVFQLLGLSIGLTRQDDSPRDKRGSYSCDITVGTGYEFGFDFLRDQASMRGTSRRDLGELFRNRLRGRGSFDTDTIQRSHQFAIIDEIDSVLLDEGNAPLILSKKPDADVASATVYRRAAFVASQLKRDQDYLIDQRAGSVRLTDAGVDNIFQSNSAPPELGLLRPWPKYVEQALQAAHVLRKDVDYVIRDEQIVIVDKNTGRIFADRTWRDGLHQAVEVEERVEVSPGNRSFAQVSRQRYYAKYDRLCGMTGTATGHEQELYDFYGLPVVVIPPRVPSRRQCLPTRFFATRDAKLRAIVQDVQQRRSTQRPILLGTTTIEESFALAREFNESQVPHLILNGVQDEDEAELIRAAGQAGTITIATNMAGRGTNIKLCKQSLAAGGLHVIGTECQDSRRLDRQLGGRTARQGDPGSYQFFVSAEDRLVSTHGNDLAANIARDCDEHGESSCDWITDIRRLQDVVEKHNFQKRRELSRHDDWMDDVLTTIAHGTLTTESPVS